jgi:hypothetical protein
MVKETSPGGAGEVVVVALGSMVVVVVVSPGQEQGGGVGEQVTAGKVPLGEKKVPLVQVIVAALAV